MTNGLDNKHPLVGCIIKETYEVLELIGHGSYSPVFSVRHLENGNEFAMKTLDRYLSGDDRFIKALNREIGNLKRLDEEAYKYIVRPEESGIIKNTGSGVDDAPFIIMEKMDGSMQEQELNLEQMVFCMIEATKGLESAHNNDPTILNLDFHANNVLVIIEGLNIKKVKVSDFGVSANMEYTGRYSGGSENPIKYPAFEQTRAGKKEHELSPKTDVYQVGATLLELTTGMDEPKPGYEKELDKFEDVPIELRELIKDCLELYPKERPEMKNVRERLQKLPKQELNEYQLMIMDATNKLRTIMRRREDNPRRTLTPEDIDILYKTLKIEYRDMKKKKFGTPVGRLEAIMREAMENDRRTVSIFAGEYHRLVNGKIEPIEGKYINEGSDEDKKRNHYVSVIIKWQARSGKTMEFDPAIWSL